MKKQIILLATLIIGLHIFSIAQPKVHWGKKTSGQWWAERHSIDPIGIIDTTGRLGNSLTSEVTSSYIGSNVENGSFGALFIYNKKHQPVCIFKNDVLIVNDSLLTIKELIRDRQLSNKYHYEEIDEAYKQLAAYKKAYETLQNLINHYTKRLKHY